MKLIPLTQGQFAMVDDADYEAVSQFKWHALKKGRRVYAARAIRKPDGKRGRQYLHQFLMPGVGLIDHIDGNGCNDRMGNLRPATRQQNVWGFKRKRLDAKAKFRGVTLHKCGKWMARIKANEKPHYLGLFANEEDAARAYDSAAVFYFGEWASTNFPVGEISIT